MATDHPVNADTLVYCAVSDVARVLNKATDYFTASTVPSETSVQEYIKEAQDQVDTDTGAAWRPRKVTNEYHDIDTELYRHEVGIRIKLLHRYIKSLDTDEDDKIELWNGQDYVDMVTDRTEGRNSDFWLDYEAGVLYLNTNYYANKIKAIRATYRYGDATVPHTIQQACAIQAAIMILLNEDRSFILNETGSNESPAYDQRIATLEKRYKRLLNNHQSIFVV